MRVVGSGSFSLGMPKLSAYMDAASTNDQAYNSTIDVYRNTNSTNDSGGVTNSWAVVSSGLGRIREMNDHERLANDVRKDKLTHKFYCDPTMDIQRGDVAVLTNCPMNGTNTFIVVHAHLPDNVVHHYELKAKSFIMGSNETPTGFAILGD